MVPRPWVRVDQSLRRPWRSHSLELWVSMTTPRSQHGSSLTLRSTMHQNTPPKADVHRVVSCKLMAHPRAALY
jgi:hypothetical protein